MTAAIILLAVLGLSVLVILTCEGNDEWAFGPEAEPDAIRFPYKVSCPECGFVFSRASHPGVYEVSVGTHGNCEFQGGMVTAQ